MNIERANEIMESLGIIDVYCDGFPVWIENIKKETKEVMVKNLMNDKEKLVDVEQLEEN